MSETEKRVRSAQVLLGEDSYVRPSLGPMTKFAIFRCTVASSTSQSRGCHHGFRTIHRPEQKLLIKQHVPSPRAAAASTLGARFVLGTS